MPRRCSRNTFLSPSPPTRSSRACRWSYLVTPPTLRNSHSVRVSTSISGLAHVRSKRPFPSLITLRYTVLLRLGANVDWENEKPCFASFLRELAFFYSPSPSPVGAAQPQPGSKPAPAASASEDPTEQALRRTIEHVLFPAAKQYLVAPAKLLERDVVLATSLEALYRVFERC
jgi:hypothetical protein